MYNDTNLVYILQYTTLTLTLHSTHTKLSVLKVTKTSFHLLVSLHDIELSFSLPPITDIYSFYSSTQSFFY